MRLRARSLGVVALLMATMIGCRADEGAETTLAVGYANGDDYRTAVIALSPDSAAIVADLPGIVVRRATGWLRLGVYTRCDDSGTAEVIWQLEGANPAAVADSSCADGSTTTPDSATGDSAHADDVASACTENTARIEFVSPTYVASVITAAQTEECEPRGGRWRDSASVRRLDSDRSLDLRDVLGDAAIDAYDSAVASGFRAMVAEGWNCPQPERTSDTLTSWTIGHARGRWRAIAASNTDAGECEVFGPVDLPLPDSLTGEAPPTVTFDALAKSVPSLGDFVVSPGGRYVLILSPPEKPLEVSIYALPDDRPGRKLLDVRLPLHRLIMTRWATGAEAQAWKELGR